MAEENKPDEELKLREDADGSVVIGDEPPAKPESEEAESDGRLASDEEDDDEQGHAEETEEDRAARTERNRQRRKAAKEFKKQQLETLKRELAARDAIINELNQRVAVVERKSTGSEMAQLDAAEKEAAQYYNHFKALNQQAIEQANGAAATEAQEKMFAAAQRIQQLQNIKKAMTQRQQQPAPLDPRLVNHAQNWMERNNWYDPNGSDEDSALVLSIDSRLAQQGWDPTTPQYWEELDSRIKKYLPHRVNQGYNKSQVENRKAPPKSPVAGSGRESASSSHGNSYRLSPERVQALKDAGLWDDPKARAAAIQRFQQYDKEQRA